VHSFYQNVLLPDADKQIEALFYEIQEMKDQLKSSKSERTKLRKENKELKKIIERYRKIVGDFQAEQQIV
jgi:regulator of replication initiation timing